MNMDIWRGAWEERALVEREWERGNGKRWIGVGGETRENKEETKADTYFL